ncbi:DUF4189 domain-containing protein [uncultured Rubinisphaera sp.]|uniref:DUF4189 domain-containing protein n=1 Tax=uncultured Rubinisphaera sp. TaxID=1678686 RepID=UPI000EE352CD|nr:hypothetical protein [Planctomycetaceae bacterium]|tara:strand:- start:329 stop:1468 length:1140 start_codon:yes stop_codon:yes gene_type:complete
MNMTIQSRIQHVGLILLLAFQFVATKAILAEDYYGAIVYSSSTKKYGYSWGHSTQESAEEGANSVCTEPDAKVVMWTRNAWYALALSNDKCKPNAWSAAWGNTQEEAEQIALDGLKKHTHCGKIELVKCVIPETVLAQRELDQKIQSIYNESVEWIQEGYLNGGREKLLGAIELGPNDQLLSDIEYLIGVVDFHNGDYQEAFNNWESSIDHNLFNPKPRAAKAIGFIITGHPEWTLVDVDQELARPGTDRTHTVLMGLYGSLAARQMNDLVLSKRYMHQAIQSGYPDDWAVQLAEHIRDEATSKDIKKLTQRFESEETEIIHTVIGFHWLQEGKGEDAFKQVQSLVRMQDFARAESILGEKTYDHLKKIMDRKSELAKD